MTHPTSKATMMGAMGILALLFSGCSASPADPRPALEQKAVTIDTATQDLLEALDAAGLDDATARGVIDACRSEPAPGVSYRAGIGVTVGDDLAAGYDALVEQLQASGWTETDDYDDVDIDPQMPAGRFTRDDVTVDIKTGGATVGETRHGADRMDLGITVADACVDVPDGGYITKVKDLEKEILPRD